MKFLKIIVGIVIVLLAAGLLLYVYSGGFKSVEVEERGVGPLRLVFAEHYGDYSKTREIQDSIYEALKEYDVHADKRFGIYYDKPENTPTDELYSLGGCILEVQDTNKVKVLKRKGFRIERMNKTPSIVVSFPNRTDWSMLLGVSKAYNEIEDYLKKHDLQRKPAMEIYTPDSITFSMEKVPE